MKYFYLKFTPGNNLTQDIGDPRIFRSGVIDLYSNDQYQNYSVHKSKYGLNLLGDYTWTGLEDVGEVGGDQITSSGFVTANNRYVDASGRIDVTRQSMDVIEPLSPVAQYYVNYYSTDEPDDDISLWNSKTDIVKGRNIYRIDSERYAQFEVVWTNVTDLNTLDFEYIVNVEIDEPVIAPLFDSTKTVLTVFPEWMALREDSVDAATPELATPNTVGGALINAVAGAELDDIRASMTYLRSQMILTDADPTQKDWIYIIEDAPERIFSITGDGVELARAVDTREFYSSTPEDDVCFHMDFANTVWLNKDYTTILINGEAHESKPVHVWNWFDEHGLLFDITRHYLESNESFRLRVLDIFRNPPGTTLERIKLAIRRELNLWATDPIAATPATPDSFAEGSTPTILEIDDIIKMDEYFTPDGLATKKMKDLVRWMAETYPTTWGFFKWGQALWDPGGENNEGYFLLPHQFDATPANLPLQAGVGDLDDLYLYHPEEISLVSDFEYRLRIKGLTKTMDTEYRKANLSFTVQPKSDVDFYIDRAEADVTVWVQTVDELYWSKVHLDSGLDRSPDPITGDRASVVLDLIDDSGNLNKSLTWGVDGDPAPLYGPSTSDGPPQIPVEDIVGLEVQWGWDHSYASTTPGNAPDSGYGTLLFPNDATPATLAANSTGTKLTASEPDAQLELVAAWDNSAVQTETYAGPKEHVEITMNGAAPDNQKKNFIYYMPEHAFPVGSDSGTQVWEIELTSLDENQQGAAYSQNEQGETIEIPSSNIAVNGSTTWTSNKKTINYAPNTDLEFETLDIVGVYPSPYVKWVTFDNAGITTYDGVVDANGAWFNGEPANEGSNENRLQYFSNLSRSDFGLANTDDHIVTWMGVELLDNADATVYMQSNTVKPAEFVGNLDYPENSIVEVYDGDISEYVFSGFYVYANKKSRFNPEWNPYIHSGWFYTGEDEYYLYADKAEESGSGPEIILAEQSKMGAPIIVRDSTGNTLRQVAFLEDLATPILSTRNTEYIHGNGTDYLYLSYENVNNVTVTNLENDTDVTLEVGSDSSVIRISEDSDFGVEYEVKYDVDKSFTADNNYLNENGELTTSINILDSETAGPYTVIYEASNFNFATPVDIPLNPFYTMHDEGFVFISYDEHDFSSVEVKLNPGTIASTDEDYLLVTVHSVDVYGNPKPQQTFDVSTDWGTLSASSIETDEEGYGFVVLTGENNLNAREAHITVSQGGDTIAQMTASVGQVVVPRPTIVALPTADAIPADGISTVTIYGRVLKADAMPMPYAVVNYRRGTSIKNLFQSSFMGQVVADETGKFIIGPITSSGPDSPGSVFYAVETWSDGAPPIGEVDNPNFENATEFGPIGDIVYWREYPAVTKFVNEFNELPIDTEIFNVYESHFMSTESAFPVGFDEATPIQPATPNLDFDWNVPEWYHISAYKQYQLGLRGTEHYEADYYAEESHPDYKEF